LKAVTLSCMHVPDATSVSTHCTVLPAVDVVAALMPVRHPRYAVG
jgi:hypothetical protein